MNRYHRLVRPIVAAVTVVALLAPIEVSAAPPLPLPSVVFYGVASGTGGPLAAGLVKVALPGGGFISAPIGAVTGTGYNYSVALPLGMPSAGTSLGDPQMAALGDTIRFYMNDTLALFKDQSGIARAQFTIPAGVVGEPYLMNLSLVGPEAFPLGDVNASGARDSADSLLVLRYDVGLTMGGATFPPPPRTIYVPLCDIVDDGRCNSSDALRILQCDAGMPGVVCPLASTGVSIASLPDMMTDTARLTLRTDFSTGPAADVVTVRLVADDPLAQLGAATIDLQYDPVTALGPTCEADPAGSLDGAFCNSTYLTGTARISTVSVKSAGTKAVLAALTFRLADRSITGSPAALGEYLSRTITLAPQSVFDAEGEPLAWRLGSPQAKETRIYLPLVARGESTAPAPTASATPSPTRTRTSTPTPTTTRTPAATLTATRTGTPAATPTPTSTPTAKPTGTSTATRAPSVTPSAAPTGTATSLPQPTATATAAATAAPSATPTAAPTATPTTGATSTPAFTPTATIVPTATPTPPAATATARP